MKPKSLEAALIAGILCLAGMLLAPVVLSAFEPAEVPAMVTQVNSDMRTIAFALEAYQLEHADYPPAFHSGVGFLLPWGVLARLTTPVAYLEAIPLDPFSTNVLFTEMRSYSYVDKRSYNAWGEYNGWGSDIWDQVYAPPTGAALWRLASLGPDEMTNWAQQLELGPDMDENMQYDSTNGTISDGDIIIWGPFAAVRADVWMLYE